MEGETLSIMKDPLAVHKLLVHSVSCLLVGTCLEYCDAIYTK
jgi:hypothetical protein